MADQYTPEEIAEIFEAYSNAVKTGTPVSKELAQAMKDAAVGAKGYAQAQDNLMKSLGKSVTEYTKAMYKGEQGAKAFNNSIDAVTDALGALLLIMLPLRGISLAAKLAVGGLLALGKATKLAGEQSDKLYKGYQDLSRAGAATAGGMTDVYESMRKLNYGIDELDKMAALVRDNSKSLGLFSGTVAAGTKTLANTAQALQAPEVLAQFKAMGLNVDDVNRGLAGYIVQQGRLGRLQGQTQADLNKGAQAYIKEMEILTRLTGQTREEMEQQREQAYAIDQFFATLQELEPAQAAEVQKVFNQLMAIDPSGSKARAFAESMSGFVGMSEDQNKLFMASSGALVRNIDGLKNGTMNAGQYLDNLGTAVKGNEQAMRQFAKTGAGAETFGGLYSNTRLANKAMTGFEKSAGEAADSLNVLDPLTQSAADLRVSQIQARNSLQDFVQLGVKPATDALAGMARLGAGGASVLPGAGPAPAGGGAGGQPQGPSLLDRAKKAIFGGTTPGLDGLRIKSSEAYAGGETSQQMLTVAHAIQQKLGGDLKYFSAFNDTYERGTGSLHSQGRALDFTLNDPSRASSVADMIRGIPGISKVIDEYANPSRSATGGHIHAEIAAARGAVLSGPMNGYQPNLTMHGTEAIVPLNNQSGASSAITNLASNFGQSADIMTQQLDKLDDLVRVMQDQVSISAKILQRSS
jgi:hypothetical protein